MRLKSIMKKSLRSLIRNKGSYIACILVLALGISVFIAMLSIFAQMKDGIDRYYRENRFGDVFANVSSMPAGVMKQLAELEGISAVDGVLTKTVRVLDDESEDIITIKLIGAETDEQQAVNQYTYQGEELKYNDDLWLGKAFYHAHNLVGGDTFTLLINGKAETFSVRGIVESPEYITVISDTAFLPDDNSYTIGFIRNEALEAFTAMKGQVTEVSFLLEDGYDFDDVQALLEQELEQYGLQTLYARADQTSHFYLSEEFAQITIIGTILPVIFLLVSFIMLYIMLKRLIEQERGQIGTFKAFGYTGAELLAGYLLYGLTVGFLSFILGLVISYPLGAQLYATYQQLYSLPEPDYMLSGRACAAGLGLFVVVSTISALMGADSVLKIRPAEAMRAKAPRLKHSGIRLHGRLSKLLFTQSGIMAIRSILRNRTRSALIVLSIISAFTIINVIYALGIACTDTIVRQPRLTELYDVKASFEQPISRNEVLSEVRRIRGVQDADSVLTVPVQLVHQNVNEDAAIHGSSDSSAFYRILDVNGRYHEPPANGILLNRTLAEKLGVRVNDMIEIKSPYLKEDVQLTVVNIIEETLGAGCYMEINSLSSLFYPEPMVTQVLIRGDTAQVQAIRREMTGFPNVLTVLTQERQEEVHRKMLSSLVAMVYAFIIMSFFMGFGAIYNVSRISLAERQRELATMRIIGYRIDETAAINSFEQWLMLMIGVLLGFGPAYLLKDYMASLFSNDLYMLHVELTLTSTAIAVGSCVLAVILANLAARNEIKQYHLAEVLRERE